MNELKGRDQNTVRSECKALSLQHPGKYILPFVDFGTAFASILDKLTVYSPGDTVSTWRWYALNGEIKAFSAKQIEAYHNTCYDGKN